MVKTYQIAVTNAEGKIFSILTRSVTNFEKLCEEIDDTKKRFHVNYNQIHIVEQADWKAMSQRRIA